MVIFCRVVGETFQRIYGADAHVDVRRPKLLDGSREPFGGLATFRQAVLLGG
jgi:hypothetical protein